MSTVQDLQSALLDATKLLSDKSTSEAKYAYTIKCTIKGIENASLHLYTVEYGANTFNAYANSDVIYKENDIVYVLVPDGDFVQQKQIIGAYAPKASMYVPEEESDIYVSVTENLFHEVDQVDLKSWEDSTDNVYIDTSNFNLVFNDYLTEGNRDFKFTARIKTEIDKDHRIKGNYGLILNLPFKQVAAAGGSTQVWRSYVMDVSTVPGDPYNFVEWNKVDLYYNLDEDLEYDSSRQPTITSFVSGFGYAEPRTDIDYDIHIKDIGIEMVDVLTQTDMEGYCLTVVASGGHYFLRGEFEDSKTLSPVLKVKGKTENQLSKWECYWFVEDTSIGIDSDDYLNFGGLGWKCLNKKTNVTYDSTGKQVFQYVTNQYNLTVKDSDVTSTLKYKCVLVQDTVVVGGTVTLKNLNSKIEVSLFSATHSNIFVAEVGYVDLVARIYYPDLDPAVSLSTAWQRFDKNDNYLDNNFYEIVRNNDPVVITTATGETRTVYETEIRYPTTKVDQINTINCTFYSTIVDSGEMVETNLGSASLVVATSKNFTYGLAIEGGDVLYKYDSDGDSPLVANYDGPLSSRVKTIQPISYKMYKADGTELTDIEYLYCKFTWSFPKNSMMTLKGYDLNSLPQDDDYYYVSSYGKNNLNYTILNTYNKKKSNNSIILNTEFANNNLSSVVTPKFLKEGESGTNGTKYSAVVTFEGYGYGERDDNGRIRKLQFVSVNGGTWQRYDIPNEKLVAFGSPTLKVEVYADGNKISSGYSVSWGMFDVTADSNTNTANFSIDNNGLLKITQNWTNSITVYTNMARATITITENSVTNSREVIYAYYPIEITRINGTTNYNKIPTLVGGFDEVVYGADGTNPEYDSSDPFECRDSLYNDTTEDYQYTWTGSSNLKIPSGSTYQKKATPVSKFDNGISKNYIKVTLGMNQTNINKINSLINDLNNNKIPSTQNLIDYYSYNKTNLFDFIGIFSYNNYVGILNNSKNLLSYRGQAMQIINNMYNIIEDINTYCQKSNIQISDFNYTSIYTSRRNSLNSAKSYLYNLLRNGSLSSLTDLSNALISLPDRIKDKYGVSIYSNLKSLIDGWNEQIISKYQPIYVKLVQQSGGAYILQTELDNLQNNFSSNLLAIPDNRYLQNLVTTHQGLAPAQEFVNLQSQLRTLVNKISSVDGGLNTYSTIVDVLKGINKLLNIYQNTDYQNKYYNNLNTKYTNQLIEYQKQLDGYQKAILPNNINYIIHIKPIIMVYNTYELSHLNGWDGNKLYVDANNNEYLFAPQMGAGTKNSSNQFTGIVMGVKKFNKNSNQQIGLFGYSAGIQSLFLNSVDGSAIFGKSGGGQIIIDPNATITVDSEKRPVGFLYSTNFWKNYNNDGKPSSYSSSNYNGKGMLIDLTTPEIRFGSGNFVVNSSGHLTAKGGGSIAGWQINDTQIYSNVTPANGRLTLDSTSPGKIYSHDRTSISDNKTGFFISKDGLSVNNGTSSKIQLLTDGTPVIYSNGHNALNSTAIGFYIGNDGISVGDSIRISSANDGSILVGRISGTKKWTINGNANNSYIAYGTKGNNNSVYIGTDEILLGQKLTLKPDGSMSGGTDNNKKWSIATDGEATFNYLKASKGGEIGGWTIYSNKLKGGDTTLYNDGKIECSNLIASTAGTIGGFTIGSDSLTGSGVTLSNGAVTCGSGAGTISMGNGNLSGNNFSLGSTGLSLTGGSINFGGSSWNGNGVAFGGNASYGSTGTAPFSGGCITHINSLSVSSVQASKATIGYLVADDITATMITTKIASSDITTSGTIKCGVITATSSSGSSIDGSLSVKTLTASGTSWKGGTYGFSTAEITTTTGTIKVLVPDKDGTKMLISS